MMPMRAKLVVACVAVIGCFGVGLAHAEWKTVGAFVNCADNSVLIKKLKPTTCNYRLNISDPGGVGRDPYGVVYPLSLSAYDKSSTRGSSWKLTSAPLIPYKDLNTVAMLPFAALESGVSQCSTPLVVDGGAQLKALRDLFALPKGAALSGEISLFLGFDWTVKADGTTVSKLYLDGEDVRKAGDETFGNGPGVVPRIFLRTVGQTKLNIEEDCGGPVSSPAPAK